MTIWKKNKHNNNRVTVERNVKELPAGRLLGIDYGQKRVGVALSDPSQFMASTLTTIIYNNNAVLIKELKKILAEHDIAGVVVGRPVNMNGTIGEMAEKAGALAEQIETQTRRPVVLWDERWSSQSAKKLMLETGTSPSKNKERIDQIAAAYILQSYLDYLGHQKRKQK